MLAEHLSPEVRQHFLASLVAYPAVLQWRGDSRRVLQVHRQLIEDLANGDAPTIPGDQLDLPFSALYVELPRGITMEDPMAQGYRLNVDGVLVACEAEAAERYSRRTLRLYVIGAIPQRWPAGIEPILLLSIRLDHRRLRGSRFGPEGALGRVHVPQDFQPYAGAQARDPARDQDVSTPAKNDFGTLMLCLLNDLSSRDNDRKSDRRRTKAIKRGAQRAGASARPEDSQSFTSYYFAGHIHAKSGAAGGWRDGRPLAFQVRVRRHKRWQACGPGYSQRKAIWIEAHKRGGTHGSVRTTRSRVQAAE